MRSLLHTWSQDRLLKGIIKNSSYLFGSNAISIILGILQGVLVARVLGAAGYGLVAGVVIPFASNVHRLLSFRMSELVVKYLGQYLVEQSKTQAGALVKGAALIEALTSATAYLVLVGLAPLAAKFLAKDPQAQALIVMYGLVLLANGTYETATGVLQVTRQFRWIARVSLLQNILTATAILLVYLLHGGMQEIIAAYLIGKVVAGLALNVVAYVQLKVELGGGWLHGPMQLPWRELSKFAVSTNLHATITLFVRDSETLLISALRSSTEAGYFKIALGVINLVMMPIEPLIATTYAEISRSISQRDWSTTRRLLKRVSSVSGAWTVATSAGLALTGCWLIPFLYGSEYRPAYPALVILLAGYGFANIFNWNRSLLLALEMPTYPLKVTGLFGLVKTVLTLLLVPAWGFVVEAVILSGYFIGSISLLIYRGLAELRFRESRAAIV